jgi:PKD repeat protein
MKNACVNTSLDLVNLSDSGGLYVWNFGDGNFSADYLPEHRYVQVGDFDIKLKVISDQNCSDSVSKSLSVYAKFLCQNQAMEVKNTSVNASGFEWNFGDGSFSIAQSPKHIYSNPGNYAIRLNTISSDGCKDSTVVNVSIFALPDSVFTIIQKLNTLILKARHSFGILLMGFWKWRNAGEWI